MQLGGRSGGPKDLESRIREAKFMFFFQFWKVANSVGGGGTTWKAKGKLAARNLGHLTDPPTPLLQLHFSCHHLCTMCAMRYELVECNQFQANTFLYFNLGYEIKNGPQLCSKIDQNMFNAYSAKYIFPN